MEKLVLGKFIKLILSHYKLLKRNTQVLLKHVEYGGTSTSGTRNETV